LKVANDLVVEVQGTLDLGVLTALKVVLPSKIPPKPVKNVRLKGTVSDLSGSCPTKVFTVSGQEVRTSASTKVFSAKRALSAVACPHIALDRRRDMARVPSRRGALRLRAIRRSELGSRHLSQEQR
jgi:hypothetical protein